MAKERGPQGRRSRTARRATTTPSRTSTRPAWCSPAPRSSRCAPGARRWSTASRASPTARSGCEDAHIPEYTQGTWTNHEPRRKRKLLLHRDEIEKLAARRATRRPDDRPAVAVLQGRPGQGRDRARPGQEVVRQAAGAARAPGPARGRAGDEPARPPLTRPVRPRAQRQRGDDNQGVRRSMNSIGPAASEFSSSIWAAISGELLALALSRLLLRGEVDSHREAAVVGHHVEAAEDLRSEVPGLSRRLVHDLARPTRVGGAARHHLDEAGLIRVAREVDHHVLAVDEGDVAGERLGDLGPPRALLGPVAVAPRRLGGLEAGERDEPAVRRDAGSSNRASRTRPAPARGPTDPSPRAPARALRRDP